MEKELKDLIGKTIRESIMRFFEGKDVTVTHVLDYIFPVERRIRSLIGGLETSIGTTVWEPLAKTLAVSNDFEVLDKTEFLMPKPVPPELLNVISEWEQKRQSSGGTLLLEGYIAELRRVIPTIDKSAITLEKITPGEGVDLWIKKGSVEYAFDIKTNQINQGGGIKHNKTLMNWYAYRLYRDPEAQFQAHIAFPFNPYDRPWWEKNGSRAKPLVKGVDAWVQEEFWDFIYGHENTWDEILSKFKELGEQGFGNEFHSIFYKK